MAYKTGVDCDMVSLAKVVKAGILRWWMLLIINSLETPKVAPLPNIMELETPVALVTVFGSS